MGLFGSSKSTNQKTTIGKVTLYTKAPEVPDWGGGFAYIGSPVSPTSILAHMDVIKKSDRAFAEEVIDYMRHYDVLVETEQKLPDPNDTKAMEAFAKKRSAKSKLEPKWKCIHNSTQQHLYIIEYGEADPSLKLGEDMAKEMSLVILARNPLEPKYEKYAQDITEIFRENPDDFDALRKIGQQINDHDRMILIARRAERLCGEAGISKFSIRVLEYAWKGIAGWSY